MKTKIIIAYAAVLSIALSAFSYINLEENKNIKTGRLTESIYQKEEPGQKKEERLVFSYDLGPRHRPITKGQISELVTLRDLMTPEESAEIKSIASIKIIVIKEGVQSSSKAYSKSAELSKSQKNLLQSSLCDTQFMIGGDCIRENSETKELTEGFYHPHYTIVPYQQAFHSFGKDSLVAFLKSQIEDDLLAIAPKKTAPAIVYFTVNID